VISVRQFGVWRGLQGNQKLQTAKCRHGYRALGTKKNLLQFSSQSALEGLRHFFPFAVTTTAVSRLAIRENGATGPCPARDLQARVQNSAI
jgi:hypothetical protein